MSGGGAGADADAQEAQTLLQLVSSMERSKQEASIFVPLSFFFSLVTEREVSASGLHSKMCAPTCNFQKSKHTHTHTHTRTHFLVCSISKQRSPHRQLLTFFFCFFCVFIIFCVHYFLVFRKRGLRTNSAGGLTCCSAVVCASHVCCVRVCRISRMAYCRMCSPTVECVLLV